MSRHGVEGEAAAVDAAAATRTTKMGSRRGAGLFSCLNRRITRILLAVLALIALLYWHLRSSSFGSNFTVQHGPARSPLTHADGQFWLEGKPLVLLSGSVHYFRIVPEYWRDRLARLKAAGLNTVSTYVPWNLHEEVRGQFSFGGILDIRR